MRIPDYEPPASPPESEPDEEFFGEYFPVVWVSRGELLAACVAFEDKIDTLDEAAMGALIIQLGEVLRDSYLAMIPVVLEQLLKDL